MRKTVFGAMLGCLLAMCVAAAQPTEALASPERTLTWEDLAPPEPDLRAPFAHLKEQQFSDLYELYKLQQWRKLGNDADDSGLAKQVEELTASLKAAKIDVPVLLQKLRDGMAAYEQYGATPVSKLNGQVIRLPGYVLPLEFGGEAVSEFFLVPNVGACIHTPAPPANQIVLVKLNQTYKIKELYDAVWVTGKLKVVRIERELGYRDGAGSVTSTYELEGTRIIPYQ
jgi:hypothetical protein